MNGHERLQELLAADALGAADPEGEDERALLDHLVVCGDCRELYRQFRETAGDLALAAEPASITPAFEQRVLAVVRARPSATRARWRALVGLVAAAVTVTAVLGTTAVRMAQRADRAEAALAILADPAARTAEMKSIGVTGAVSVTVARDTRGVMLGSGLQVSEGKVLVLWLVSSRGPERLAVASPRDGEIFAPFELNLSADSDSLAVTVEDGPVDEPTTDPIFTGSFTF